MTRHVSLQGKQDSRRFDITLAGDANLDILLYGLPENLPPERELLAGGMAIRPGGSAAITAHNMAALGHSVGFITTVAGDDLGKLCQAELRQAGVDLSRCVPVEHTQTGVTVLLQHELRRHMFTYAGATFHLSYSDLDLDYLADARHFHMASYYLQRSLTPQIPLLFATLKEAGLTISLDPNDDPAQQWDRCILEALPFVDLLMPNEREACLLAAEPDLDKAIAILRSLVPLLVVKRGVNGASAFSGSQSWHAPSRPIKVVDAVGAGDSFNAGFLHAWTRGRSIEQALGCGNLAGAWSTTASGGTSAFHEPDSLRALQAALAESINTTSP
ncbi:MAG: carbohydrate kinase family protein [Terracidiphilus sp.]